MGDATASLWMPAAPALLNGDHDVGGVVRLLWTVQWLTKRSTALTFRKCDTRRVPAESRLSSSLVTPKKPLASIPMAHSPTDVAATR